MKKKILFVTKNWVGDILFEFPAIEAIKKQYPDSTIACLAPKRCQEILENHPDIDQAVIFDERNEHKSLWARLKFILKLRKEKWDQAYLFHRSKTRAFVLLLGGVRERIGFGGKRKLFLTKIVEEPQPIYHQVDHFLKMLDGIDIPYPEKAPYRFYFTPEHEQSAQAILEENQLTNFVCFHLGANWEPKRWPPKHFAELADKLYSQWKITIVVTGAVRDMPLYEAMMEHVKEAKVVCLVGKTGLGELGAIFKQALFMVSGDSGPLHVATGVGTRVVALFGPTDPALTGPRGVGEEEVIRYVPPGYQAPWYGKDGKEFPREGWLEKILPDQVMKVVETKKWFKKNDKPFAIKLGSKKKPEEVKENKSVKKILVVTLSNIGDVILTTPVITSLAEQFPDAQITVVSSPKTKDLLTESRLISRVVIYDKRVSWIKKFKMILELRKDRYDVVVDLRNTLIPYMVSARKRSPLKRSAQSGLVRDQHLEVLSKMGLHSVPTKNFDFFDYHDEDTLLEMIKSKGIVTQGDWIVIAPAAASELKTWKLEGFAEVIRKLLENRSENILLVGDTREREIIEPLCALDPTRIFNIAGQTTLRQLACAVSKSLLLVTNDSAVMHFGFELQKPVVAIFGPTSEHRYGRQGKNFKMLRGDFPCPSDQTIHRLETDDPFKGLEADQVFEACQELLNENTVSA